MKNLITTALLILLINTGSASAASYYVKPDGDDSANGLSDAAAWKSIEKINQFSFRKGDDVYLLSGGKWNKRLVVDWSGSATNPVIVGSYYMHAGKEVSGIKADTDRPTLAGTYPMLNVAGAMPTNNWRAMVQVNANYVTVKDLRVEKSSGSGIVLNKARHHAIFENNEVDVSAGSSIIFSRKSHSNIMRNNKMRKCAQAWKDKIWPHRTWPICNGAVGSRNNVIENNLVTESYGEGIVAYSVRANNNIIKGNTIVVVRSVGIYIDNGANNIIENNIVVGDSAGGGNKGSAFGLSVEDYKHMKDATGNIFRNNLVANTKTCLWMKVEPKAQAKGRKVGGKFIGNTCIGVRGSVKHFEAPEAIHEFQVSNNIFYDIAQDSCKFPRASTVTFSNNLWQEKPQNIACQGHGDVIADPKLSKSSGWNDINPRRIPSVADFTPQPDSPAYGAGSSLNVMDKDFYGNVRPSRPAIGAIDVSNTISAFDFD